MLSCCVLKASSLDLCSGTKGIHFGHCNTWFMHLIWQAGFCPKHPANCKYNMRASAGLMITVQASLTQEWLDLFHYLSCWFCGNFRGNLAGDITWVLGQPSVHLSSACYCLSFSRLLTFNYTPLKLLTTVLEVSLGWPFLVSFSSLCFLLLQ